MRTARGFDFDIGDSIAVLSATPATLTGWLSPLPERWSGSSGDRDDWAPYDVVGHLIHCDETDWLPRARVILAQGDDRNFPSFDRFGHFESSLGKSLTELLQEFSAIRASCLNELASWNLSEDQLLLTGIHPEFGEVSLRQLIATWVVHDQTHIRQIAVSLARRYDSEVGPWKAYLGILNQ